MHQLKQTDTPNLNNANEIFTWTVAASLYRGVEIAKLYTLPRDK